MKSFPLLLLGAALLGAALWTPGQMLASPRTVDLKAQVAAAGSLRHGEVSERVAQLQQLLRDHGFDPGPIDGIFGPLTEGAVRRAQADYGLTVDGLAGRLTVGALLSQPAAATGSSSKSPATAPPKGTTAVRTTLLPPEDSKGSLVLYQASGDSGSNGVTAAGDLPSAVTTTAATSRTAADSDSSPTASAADSSQVPGSSHATTGPGQPGTSPPKTGPEKVALTFNGLPDKAALDGILAALHAYDMTATFFVSGERAEADPELMERLRNSGHELANLGYSGVDMTRVSPMTARALIRRTQRAIAGATGEAPTFFRPPQGRFNGPLAQLVAEEGLSMTLWSNVIIRPASALEPDKLAAETAARLFPGAVLMLPLDRPEGAAAVEPLLRLLAAEGYQSAGLSEVESTDQPDGPAPVANRGGF